MNIVSLEAAKALQSVGMIKESDRFPEILEAVLWLWEKYGLWCNLRFMSLSTHSAGWDWTVVRHWNTRRGNSAVIEVEGTVANPFIKPLDAYNSAIIAACEWAKQNQK